MPGPWEKYQAQSDPWQRYAAPRTGNVGPVPGVDFQPGQRTGYQQFQADLPGLPQRADDVARLVARGATFGLADELAGRLPGGAGSVEAERARTAAALERTPPSIRTQADLGGAALTMGGLLPGALVSTAGRSFATGGAIGAVDTTGRALEERGELPTLAEAATGAAVGAGAGFAGWHAGNKIAELFRRTGREMPAQMVQAARDESTKFYGQMDDAGVTIKPEAFKVFADDLQRKMRDKFFLKEAAPGVENAMKIIKRAAAGKRALTLREFDEARQVVRDILPGTASKNEERLIGDLVKGFDDFANKLGVESITAGDAKAGTAALKTAREWWQRQSKGEELVKAGNSFNIPSTKAKSRSTGPCRTNSPSSGKRSLMIRAAGPLTKSRRSAKPASAHR